MTLRRAQGGPWADRYLADWRALRALNGGRAPGLDMAIDAAILVLILHDVVMIALAEAA